MGKHDGITVATLAESSAFGMIRALPAVVALLAMLLLFGCARFAPLSADGAQSLSSARQPPRTVDECRQFLQRLDALVGADGASDALARRVVEHPYLRVDRTLAAMADTDVSGERFARQMERLRQLDRSARGYELANLSAAPSEGQDRLLRWVEFCGERLLARDLSAPERRAAMRNALTVMDDYHGVARALGLYPLTALPFLAGVDRLHRSFERTFQSALGDLAVHGRLQRFEPDARYAPLTPEALRRHMTPAISDPFHQLAPDDPDLARLLAHHAPILEVDVVRNDDRIGKPVLDAHGRGYVDTSAPTVFSRLSHVYVNGAVHAQLNYLVWFPARTASGPLDLLGGHLDGLIWRVTLDRGGRALIYDSVHQCGCYHLFFPSDRAQARPPRARFEEPVFVAQRAPRGQGRIVLRIAHRTHYIERVYRDIVPAGVLRETYTLASDDNLRSLALPGGRRRSLFGHDGLVAGSERPERWLFWPMGVPSAGAMRQWGHHAVAFVGRRHFDDPELLDRHFVFTDTAMSAQQ